MISSTLVLLVALVPVAAAQDAPRSKRTAAESDDRRPGLADVMEFASESREALKHIKDYTAVFSKTELVGKRVIKQVMDIKLREQPFSVYFRYRSGPEAGREVIYVAGANRGEMLVHEEGIKRIAGTLSLRPDARDAMEENRYPITKVGMSNLLKTAYDIWETEQKFSTPESVDVKFYPNATLGQKTACQAVQITHTAQRRELPFHLSRVYFDKETKLPIRAERYGWPRRQGEKPPLVEEYTYSNIRTNVGLTDADFDPRNPHYAFPR